MSFYRRCGYFCWIHIYVCVIAIESPTQVQVLSLLCEYVYVYPCISCRAQSPYVCVSGFCCMRCRILFLILYDSKLTRALVL